MTCGVAAFSTAAAVLAGAPVEAATLAAAPDGPRAPVELTVDYPDAGCLGSSLDVDGDTLAVADVCADTVPTISPLPDGAAHVFVRAGAGWVEQARLVPAGLKSGDRFGASIAVSGDTVVAGAPERKTSSWLDVGMAFIYTRAGGTWTEARRLQPVDQERLMFGSAVDVDGRTMVVGAPRYDGQSSGDGAVLVYVQRRNGWKLKQKVVAPDADGGDHFGDSVALQGDTMLIGAVEAPTDQADRAGAVYAFERTGGTWEFTDRLTAPVEETPGDDFGATIELDGDTAAIRDPIAAEDARVYVFVRSDDGAWTVQATFEDTGEDDDRYGDALALYADNLLIGAPATDLDDNLSAGRVYRFTRQGDTWEPNGSLRSPDSTDSFYFGRALALDSHTLAIGEGDAESDGSVWIYNLQ